MSRIAVIGIVGRSVFLNVDRFHEGGETVEARSVHFELGGKGFNQAVAAARYGASVSFLCAVGEDCCRTVREFTDSEGIHSVLVKKDGESAFASIVTDKNGSNHVTVYQGVQLAADDVSAFEDCIADADILLINNEVDEAVNVRAVEIAKSHGVRVVLNPAPARESCDYIIENVDLFTPNEHETLGLEKKDNVIMTVGKRGCIIKKNNLNIPAVNAGTVVDTTGAGDTFNGVLCAALAGGAELCEAAREANTASSIGVTRKYAVSSIPTKKEIEGFLKCKRV